MKLLFFLLNLCAAFHYYADAGETKCFREELTVDISIIGAFKVLIFDSKNSVFVNGQGVQTKIVVNVEDTNHNLVDSTFDATGKFHFTAVENGVHVICVTVLGHSWFNARAKIYFDIQFGDLLDQSEDDTADSIQHTRNVVASLKNRVDGIRSELKLQREREGELREISETINSHTYRFTLVQIFVLIMGNQNSIESYSEKKFENYLERERAINPNDMPSIGRAEEVVRQKMQVAKHKLADSADHVAEGSNEISPIKKLSSTPRTDLNTTPTKFKLGSPKSIFESPTDLSPKPKVSIFGSLQNKPVTPVLKPKPQSLPSKTKALFGEGFVSSIPTKTTSKPIIQRGFKVSNPETVQAKVKSNYQSVLETAKPKKSITERKSIFGPKVEPKVVVKDSAVPTPFKSPIVKAQPDLLDTNMKSKQKYVQSKDNAGVLGFGSHLFTPASTESKRKSIFSSVEVDKIRPSMKLESNGRSSTPNTVFGRIGSNANATKTPPRPVRDDQSSKTSLSPVPSLQLKRKHQSPEHHHAIGEKQISGLNRMKKSIKIQSDDPPSPSLKKAIEDERVLRFNGKYNFNT